MRGQGEMLDWLQRDLQSTRQFWRVVYFQNNHIIYVHDKAFAFEQGFRRLPILKDQAEDPEFLRVRQGQGQDIQFRAGQELYWTA